MRVAGYGPRTGCCRFTWLLPVSLLTVYRASVSGSVPSVTRDSYPRQETACKLTLMAADMTKDAARAAAALLAESPAPLSGWYGNPMNAITADQLLSRARLQQQERLCAGAASFQLQLLETLCRDCLGSGPDNGFAALAALTGRRHERALLLLVRGQRLASRKAHGAMTYLTAGFREAAPVLESSDYFALVRQHELLEYLPWSDKPSMELALDELLTEAAVIKQLCSGRLATRACLHQDTVG